MRTVEISFRGLQCQIHFPSTFFTEPQVMINPGYILGLWRATCTCIWTCQGPKQIVHWKRDGGLPRGLKADGKWLS